MATPSPTRYRTTNWSDYNAALRKRGSLSVWFDPDMVWHAAKSGKRGRPKTFSDAAIQTCLTLKVLFGLPLRQTVGLVESLIRMAGIDWPVPDYSTLFRRQRTLKVLLPYRGARGPLNLLVDSTGIKVRGEVCVGGDQRDAVAVAGLAPDGLTPAHIDVDLFQVIIGKHRADYFAGAPALVS